MEAFKNKLSKALLLLIQNKKFVEGVKIHQAYLDISLKIFLFIVFVVILAQTLFKKIAFSCKTTEELVQTL